MQKLLTLLAVLTAACASAAAAPEAPGKPAAPATPASPPPPAAGACRPSGAAVFEIDHKVNPGAQLATSTVKLYASTAWTHDSTDADGKAQPAITGCMARGDYQQLVDRIHAAPWTVTMARVHCMAMSPAYTEYRVDGKLVFTQKLCSGQNLDDKSRAALDAATAKLEPAGKPQP